MEKQVLCLAGATGTGKTAVGIALANRLHGEIVNVDSRQVYADFPLITAQPSAEELNACPHHLYGFLPTTEKLSAGRYAEKVLVAINEIHARGKLPILVGGTGLYFKALLEGMAEIPAIANEISAYFTARCAELGTCAMHAQLAEIDPEYAAKIHPHDKQRILRALEVFEGTGKTFSWWHKNVERVPLVRGLMLGLDVELNALRPRLDERIEQMLFAGALEEARAALLHCADGKAPGWSGIGCAELFAHLQQGLALETALELWKKNTRAYAKRQFTWFRAVQGMQWFAPTAQDEMLVCAEKFLEAG